MVKRALALSCFKCSGALFVHSEAFLIKAALQSRLNMPLCGAGPLIAPRGKTNWEVLESGKKDCRDELTSLKRNYHEGLD